MPLQVENISGWSNGADGDSPAYDALKISPNGIDIGSAISLEGTAYIRTADMVGLKAGKYYQLTVDVILNSGQLPSICLGNSKLNRGYGDIPITQLSLGKNTFVWKHTNANAPGYPKRYLWVKNTQATNFSCTFTLTETLNPEVSRLVKQKDGNFVSETSSIVLED